MISSNWSRESLAWLAGLVEGEGSLTLEKNKSLLRLKVKMTDEDVIRQAALIAGVGKVYGPYQVVAPSGMPAKDQWVWVCQRSIEAYAVMVAIAPWLLSRRRKKLVEVVNEWLSHHPPGTPNGHVSLTRSQVAVIKSEFNGVRLGRGRAAALALQFNCTRGTISAAAHGHTYQ